MHQFKTEQFLPISKVQPLKYFSDKQTKGPYKAWDHSHTFIQKENGILMIDEVNYEMPFGVLGKLAERLLVRKKIKSIFDYRRCILEKLFI